MFALIASLLGVYFLSSAIALLRNLSLAKSIGIPVVWSPISPFNPFWILFNKKLSPQMQRLPFGLGEWTKHNSLDWTWIDRAHKNSEVHQTHGETFAHVTPREVEIHTRDPNVSDQVLRKKSAEFGKIGHYASKYGQGSNPKLSFRLLALFRDIGCLWSKFGLFGWARLESPP
jgi:hypothetical protein